MLDETNDPRVQKEINSRFKRYDVLNRLVSLYGYNSYLEIGVFDGENFSRIECPHKTGVDSGAEGLLIDSVTWRVTSDEFFASISEEEKFDLIFIDGDHSFLQVLRDIENSLRHLSNNGTICLHDSSPPTPASASDPRRTIVWCGEVWRAVAHIRSEWKNVRVQTVDCDFGVTIITRGDVSQRLPRVSFYDYFARNRKEILNLMPAESWFAENCNA